MVKLEQATIVGNELAVRFIDGRELYFILPYLRVNCPCAACQQKRDAMEYVGVSGLSIDSSVLISVDVVGGYAVRLTWADGHGSGIYSFDFLWKLHELFREDAF